MTPQELEVWRLRERGLQTDLAHIAADLRAWLRAMGYPTTPAALYDLLERSRTGTPQTGAPRIARRDWRRVLSAAFALQGLADVPRHISPTGGDSLQAACAAVRAALCAEIALPRRVSRHPSGSVHDRQIAKLAKEHAHDWGLRQAYPSRVGFIVERLATLDAPPSRRTIQRRLHALRLAPR